MTAPKLPEGLEPVAWRVDWPLDLIDAIAPDRFYDASDAHRMNCHLSYVQGVGPVPEPLYTDTQMREAILAATERALDGAYNAMFDLKGDKVTRFDAQTAIRKLKDASAASTGRGEGGEGV